MKTFKEFIAGKEEFYKEFEFASVHKAYDLIKPHLHAKTVIQLVGTNGKGSTGRALAHMLHAGGKRTAHYTSPHITSLRERFWIEGKNADEGQLQKGHEKLMLMLADSAETLSYFEYLTLLFFVISDQCDYIVLEAGLGGEFDATNVMRNDLCILTPVGYDHCSYLGKTIEQIAATKLRACDNDLILAPQPYAQTYEVAASMFPAFICPPKREISGFHGVFCENIQTAAAAYETLGFVFDPALLEGFKMPGRMQKIAANVTVDVGHNPLGAEVLSPLVANDTVLIYNSLDDKDIETVLQILAPKLKRVEYLPVQHPKAASKQRIAQACAAAGLEMDDYDRLDQSQDYLVFGSFVTLEAFLQKTQLEL